MAPVQSIGIILWQVNNQPVSHFFSHNLSCSTSLSMTDWRLSIVRNIAWDTWQIMQHSFRRAVLQKASLNRCDQDLEWMHVRVVRRSKCGWCSCHLQLCVAFRHSSHATGSKSMSTTCASGASFKVPVQCRTTDFASLILLLLQRTVEFRIIRRNIVTKAHDSRKELWLCKHTCSKARNTSCTKWLPFTIYQARNGKMIVTKAARTSTSWQLTICLLLASSQRDQNHKSNWCCVYWHT